MKRGKRIDSPRSEPRRDAAAGYTGDRVILFIQHIARYCSRERPTMTSRVHSLCTSDFPHFTRLEPYVRAQPVRLVIPQCGILVALFRLGIVGWEADQEVFVECVGEA
jgi:hypothetical protein